jgi:NAD(P)-dependent dehydrogenase (short-subunit alcohol dehydrogenase family)
VVSAGTFARVEASPRLRDRAYVITGSTGIADAATHRLMAEGASVFTIAIDAESCARLHDGVAGADRHGWVAADLTDESVAVWAFEQAAERFNGLDGLFAVAGGSGRSFGDGPTDLLTLAAWEETLALNLATTFLSVREAIRHLLTKEPPGGSIVVTSSIIAEHPSPEHFSTHAYATAKGAQLALVKATAAQYSSAGIRVNAIAPGLVATAMSERARGDAAAMGYIAAKQPLTAGPIDPADVASAAAFLLSDDARAITGQVLGVDAGWGVTEG